MIAEPVQGQVFEDLPRVGSEIVRPVGRDVFPERQAGVVQHFLRVLPRKRERFGRAKEPSAVLLLEFSDTALISLEEQLDDFRISHVTPHILRHILAEFWTFGEKKIAFG